MDTFITERGLKMEGWTVVEKGCGQRHGKFEEHPEPSFTKATGIALQMKELILADSLPAAELLAKETLEQFSSCFPVGATAFTHLTPDNVSNEMQKYNFPTMFAGADTPTWIQTKADGNCLDNGACLQLGMTEDWAFLLRVVKGCAFFLRRQEFFMQSPKWLRPSSEQVRVVFLFLFFWRGVFF
jgi:hypothetical protein